MLKLASGMSRVCKRIVLFIIISFFGINVVLAAGPAAPVLNTATPGNGQVALTWGAVSGATSYAVKYGTVTDVVWQNASGVTVTGNSLTKTAVSAWGNGGAVSAASFTGDGGVRFTVSETTRSRMMGLSPSSSNDDYRTIKYAIYLRSTGDLYVYENGANRGVMTTYATDDIVSVERVGTAMHFKKNGVLVYTSAVSIPASTPLFVDVALNSLASTVTNAQFFSGVGTTINVGTATTRTVTGLTNGTLYDFVVTAINAGGSSVDSNLKTVTPALPAPAAPVLNTATPGNGQVALAWGAVSGATSYAVKYGTATDVVWQNASGVTVTGNSLTKTAVSAWGNGGAVSAASFTGDGGVRFTVSETTRSRMMGLSPSSSNDDYRTIKYAIYLRSTGDLYVYENGANRGVVTTYATDDIVSVERVGTAMHFKKNSVLVYTSAVSIPASTPLFVDVALNSLASTVTNAQFFSGVGTTINVGTATTRTVTGLTNGTLYDFVVTAINAGGSSADSNLKTVTPALPAPAAPVLNTATPGNGQVALAWGAVSGATSYAVKYGTATDVVWQNASGVTVTGNSLTKTAVSAWGNGGAVSAASFTGDGGVRFTVSETTRSRMMGLSPSSSNDDYRTIKYAIYLRSTGDLYVYENGANRGVVTTYATDDIVSVERVGTAMHFKKNGVLVYTSAVSIPASTPLFVDVALNSLASTVTNAQFFTGVSTTLNVGNVTTRTVTGLTNGTIYDFVVTAINAGGSSLDSNIKTAMPVLPAPAAPVLNTATPGNGQVALAWGAVSGATSYAVKYGTVTDVVWQNAAGVTVTGNSLTKTAVSGWGNAGAGSALSFTGDGGVRVTASETNTSRMVGLSLTNPDNDYKTIKYACYIKSNGELYAYESGANRGLKSTYQTGDIISVERLGTAIVFKKNGVLLYTSAVSIAAGTPLFADVALYSVGSTVTNAQLFTYGNTVNVGAATSRTVTGLVNGTAYNFVITATNAGGTSPYSNNKTVKPLGVLPAAPVLNTATAGNAQVSLAWGAVSGATGYAVKYGTVSGVYGAPVNVGNVTSFAVTSLSNGTPYFFVVTAANASGTSALSNEKTATPVTASVPGAPILNPPMSGHNQVTLSWSEPVDNGSPIIVYNVEYGTVASGLFDKTVSSDNPTAVIKDLADNTPYQFRVSAANIMGSSSSSNVLPVTPGQTTVHFQSSGSGVKYITQEWGWQRVTYTLVTDFTVQGVNPSDAGDYVNYDLSNKSGTVRFYGTAEDHFYGATEVFEFDNTRNIEIETLEGVMQISKTKCNDVYIGFSVAPTNPLPKLFYLQYSSEFAMVRGTYEMPNPWNLGFIDNNYDATASDDAICACSLDVDFDKYTFLPGDSAEAYVTTPLAPGGSVVWETLRQGDSTARAQITTNGSDGRSATLSDMKGEGNLLVRVKNTSIAGCVKDIPIHVGCHDCGGNTGTCQIKSAYGQSRNIDTNFGLARTQRGYPVGAVSLQADMPSPFNATPKVLKVATFGDESEKIYTGNALRQILAPEVLVDVVVRDNFGYSLKYYKASDVGPKSGNVYTIAAGAQPIVTWLVENPDASLTVYNRLKITETRSGQSVINEYIWDNAAQTWSLSHGDNVQTLVSSETVAGSDRIVTDIVKNNLGQVVSKTRTVYQSLLVNALPVKEVVQVVEDPDFSARTTNTTWYADPCAPGSCGQVASESYPDGSWVKYEYDALGRISVETRSWLDTLLTATSDQAQAVYFSYAQQDAEDLMSPLDSRKPRKITEKILGQVVNETYFVYGADASGSILNITEKASVPGAAYGAAGNLRTVTLINPFEKDSVASLRPALVIHADSQIELYSYEYGTYTANVDPTQPGTFIAGVGTDERSSVIHGTEAAPNGIANKSTSARTVRNNRGETLLETNYVYNGTGPQVVGWTVYQYDELGRVIATSRSNGAQSETAWTGVNKKSSTDENGIRMDADFDALNRLKTESKMNGATPLVTRTYAYDAAGRRLSETVSGGSLSLTSSNVYDLAGRLVSSTDQAGLLTSYGYSLDNRTTTVTYPGGATEITVVYKDGQTKSLTGTAVTPQFYTYGVNADGTQWSKVNFGAASSSMWEKTTTDALGRTIKTEKPGAVATETTTSFYNNLGQLVKTTTPGQADTLYEYDALGQQVRTGLDIDSNGTLDLNSQDRITDTDSFYSYLGAQWWQESVQKVYAADFNPAATTVSTQRSRLTGLGTGGLLGESVSLDIHGNQTIAQTIVNRATQTLTQTVNTPDSSIDEVMTTVNGLLTTARSKSGITTAYSYDALERQTGVTDPRTGTSITSYNPLTGQVSYVEDAAARRTSFVYDAVSGRKVSETNPDNKITRFAYNTQGQVTHTWGDAAYPVRYAFDAYGRLSAMDTWRSGVAWTGATFPTNMEAAKDTTTWNYQEATGLLLSKTDAAGKSVVYTYGPAGRLSTRKWVRLNSGAAFITSYSYDANTAELLRIDYNDATPDVVFTYDRLGRQSTVTDGLGNRTLAYNAALQPLTETIAGLYNKTLTRTYAASGVVGRPTGFNTGAGYSITYGYDTYGRFNNAGWNITGVPVGSTSYTYVANSDLLAARTTGNQATTYTYETNRDLKTRVKNQYNSTVVSQYDYVNDTLGRRTSVANTGTAFSAAAFNKFAYNDRSELAESARYLGTNLNVLTSPVTGEYRSFQYDPIGNRTNITAAASNGSYTANNLNQYATANLPTGGTNAYTNDLDGNLTQISGVKNQQYTYDAENRLISTWPTTPVVNDKKIDNVYDFQGRRVKKTTTTWTGSAWGSPVNKLYVYDGWNVIEEQTTAQPTKYYVWGLDLSQTLQGAGGIGGLLAKVESTTTHNFLFDVNGNVGQLTNAVTGSVDAKYEYDPYGNSIVATGTQAAGNPYRFSSKYLDVESNLYYYGYRFYAPDIGRWLSRDPIEEDGGINLYGFVKNNPVDLFDINGLTWLPTAVKNWIYEKAVSIGRIQPGLPQRLLRHYIFNNGAQFTVTKNEILRELLPVTSLIENSQYKGNLDLSISKKQGSFTGTYEILSATPLNGSLGNFYTNANVTVNCFSNFRGKTRYIATGTATIKDVWDFDWKLWSYILGKLGMGPGNGRSEFGQWRTMKGSMIPGDTFSVMSEKVNVYQDDTLKRLQFR